MKTYGDIAFVVDAKLKFRQIEFRQIGMAIAAVEPVEARAAEQ